MKKYPIKKYVADLKLERKLNKIFLKLFGNKQFMSKFIRSAQLGAIREYEYTGTIRLYDNKTVKIKK